jgi:hypothetical protein
MREVRFWRGCAIAALLYLLAPAPAHADRWFGSVYLGCGSFGDCLVSPEMPDPPGDSASLQLQRSGKANAPVEIFMHVNKPIEGGAPVRLEFGETAFDLAPGDVVTRREKTPSGERLRGYWVAEARVSEVLAAMRRVDIGHLKIMIGGDNQDRLILLDGLDNALRNLDERQGRAGAQDALIDKGARVSADTAAPKPLPARAAWPKEIERIFKREKCDDRLATFDELADGSIAAMDGGHELWQIACAGGNYNTHSIMVDVRNGDMKTARTIDFPTRMRKRPDGVVTNASWWYARKELWAFERYHSHGDCGLVARYLWTARGFTLENQRRKEDCDSKFDDPWTSWRAVKSGRGSKR